jgi:hypothetical protein
MGVSWSATLSVADEGGGGPGGDAETLRLVGRTRKLIRAGTIKNPDDEEGSGRRNETSSGCLTRRAKTSIGGGESSRGTNAVWIYVDASKQVGDRDHLKVFASEVAADTWSEENDPEGVAFEYDVLE